MYQARHNSAFEVLVESESFVIVAKAICENCQRQLCRPAPGVTPLKSVWTVGAQVQARIEGMAIDGDNSHVMLTCAFVVLQGAPPITRVSICAIKGSPLSGSARVWMMIGQTSTIRILLIEMGFLSMCGLRTAAGEVPASGKYYTMRKHCAPAISIHRRF
jgi:hypothetical protein